VRGLLACARKLPASKENRTPERMRFAASSSMEASAMECTRVCPMDAEHDLAGRVLRHLVVNQ